MNVHHDAVGRWIDSLEDKMTESIADLVRDVPVDSVKMRHPDEYHEDYGPVLWFELLQNETGGTYWGSPLDSDFADSTGYWEQMAWLDLSETNFNDEHKRECEARGC